VRQRQHIVRIELCLPLDENGVAYDERSEDYRVHDGDTLLCCECDYEWTYEEGK
jgi:hypothetical protein